MKKPWALDFVMLAAVWGASFLFMHVASVEFGALPTAFMRVGVAAAFLLPILMWRKLLPQLLKNWKPLLFVGVMNSAFPFALYCFALLYISTGLGAILNATVPLFGALIAWAWLGDRPAMSRVAGLVIGFAGVAMLAWDKATFKPDASGIAPGWAVLACLGAAICYGISASFTKQKLTGVPSLVTAAGSQIAATLVLAIPAAIFWPQTMPGAHAWMSVVAVGVVCTGFAYILFFRLIETAGPARSLAVTFVVPVFAIVYGAVLLGEAVTPWMMLCGVVIVAGTSLSTGLVAPRRKSIKPSESTPQPR